ncbi:hypothetical protein [Frankia sp. QA3]
MLMGPGGPVVIDWLSSLLGRRAWTWR